MKNLLIRLLKFRVKNYIQSTLQKKTDFISNNDKNSIPNFPQTTKFNAFGNLYKINIQDDVVFREFCMFWIQGRATLSIGHSVFFNNNCSINCLEKIDIGDGCIFGEGVKLYDHNHKYTTDPIISISKDEFNTAPIIIGKNCWIGSNVTILKGVTIGDNVIIGANCLIYESIPSNSIVKLNQSLIIEKKV